MSRARRSPAHPRLAMKLETDFKEALALPRSISLAGAGSPAAVRSNEPELTWPIVEVIIGSCRLAHTTHLHTVENIEELYPQLRVDVLPKVEVFGQTDILVAAERIAQLLDLPRRIALGETWVCERRLIENREPLVIIIVIDVQRHGWVEVGAIETIQEHIVAVGENLYRKAA